MIKQAIIPLAGLGTRLLPLTSIFAKELLSEKKGPPPSVNLFNEKNIGNSIHDMINQKLIVSCHDVSLGGILVAVSKMCIKGNKGIKINPLKGLINKYEYLFGEDQGRYVVEVPDENIEKVNEILNKNSIHFDKLGVVDEKNLTFKSDLNLPLEELKDGNMYWLERFMNS